MSDDTVQVVTMPKWGLAMHEGTIAAWHIRQGETVAAGVPLCDIETAKITNEFDSPFEGIVARILKADGALVKVGEPIAVVVVGAASDAMIDAAIAEYNVADDENAGAGSNVATVETALGPIGMLQTGDAASDRAVLFIHGFGGSHSNWEFLQAELPADVRSIAIDLPGHGVSGDHVGNGSVRDLAKAVIAFVDAVGLKASILSATALAQMSRAPLLWLDLN